MQILLTHPKTDHPHTFELFPKLRRGEKSEGGGIIIDELGDICLVVERNKRRWEQAAWNNYYWDGEQEEETITSPDISDLIEQWSAGPWSIGRTNEQRARIDNETHTFWVGLDEVYPEAQKICADLNKRDATWFGLLDEIEAAVLDAAERGEV